MLFALEGLMAVQTPLNVTDPLTYNMKNISGIGLDRTINDRTVMYTYHLHEYRGLDEYQSLDKRIQTSSSCAGYSFSDTQVYHDGKVVGIVPNGTEGTSVNHERGSGTISLTAIRGQHLQIPPSIWPSSKASSIQAMPRGIIAGPSIGLGRRWRTQRPAQRHVSLPNMIVSSTETNLS
jgi:hypothetical protein